MSKDKAPSMYRIKILSAIAIAVSICIAQQMNISGKVTDTSGVTPLAGAVVALEKMGITASTGPDGYFSLTNATGINTPVTQLQNNKLSANISNGVLYVHLQKRGPVEIIIYTLHGKAVSRVHKIMGVGTHRIAQPYRGNGVYLYRIKSGKSELLLKSPSIGKVSGVSAVRSKGFTATASQASRYTPIDDVITATMSGYLNYRVIVTNSDTDNIEIKMFECADTVRDIDGNLYQAVRIGSQVWTAQNLRTTKYNDGTPITLVESISDWIATESEKYCFWNNTTNADSIKNMGAFYNWYAVNTQKLAPTGWHIPDTTEWGVLRDYLIANGYNWDSTTTGNKVAKSMAAKTGWNQAVGNGFAGRDLRKNNRSGYSGIPTGLRYIAGMFIRPGDYCNWWCTTEIDSLYAYSLFIHHDAEYLHERNNYTKICGLSVRLVKD